MHDIAPMMSLPYLMVPLAVSHLRASPALVPQEQNSCIPRLHSLQVKLVMAARILAPLHSGIPNSYVSTLSYPAGQFQGYNPGHGFASRTHSGWDYAALQKVGRMRHPWQFHAGHCSDPEQLKAMQADLGCLEYLVVDLLGRDLAAHTKPWNTSVK